MVCVYNFVHCFFPTIHVQLKLLHFEGLQSLQTKLASYTAEVSITLPSHFQLPCIFMASVSHAGLASVINHTHAPCNHNALTSIKHPLTSRISKNMTVWCIHGPRPCTHWNESRCQPDLGKRTTTAHQHVVTKLPVSSSPVVCGVIPLWDCHVRLLHDWWILTCMSDHQSCFVL